MDYSEFLSGKHYAHMPVGIQASAISDDLYPFQRDLVDWALTRGRAAIFADCGLGKTAIQLEWAKHVSSQGRVLIVAPLAVSSQTVRESRKFGIDGVEYMRSDDGARDIVVTNYEMLHAFDPADFAGVVLDESSILKSYTGKIRNQIIDEWGSVPYRLAATATPAPNDLMELGNHSEFVGAMSRTDMLSHFFVHDGGETQKWRLKGHAQDPYWDWVASWAAVVRSPADLGYTDERFTLPPLLIEQHSVRAGEWSGDLFSTEARTMIERRAARKASIKDRVARVAEMANGSDGAWVVWCDLNSESDALAKAIDGSVEVKGSDTIEHKERALADFSDGTARVIVTKPSIAGFGLNWQHCHRMAFTGLSDSYEQFYQATRRCWRFGQTHPVECHVVTSDAEGAVVDNIRRKEEQSKQMIDEMTSRVLEHTSIKGSTERMSKAHVATSALSLPEFLSCRA